MKYTIDKKSLLESAQIQDLKQKDPNIPVDTSTVPKRSIIGKIVHAGVPLGIVGGAAYGANALVNKLGETLAPVQG